MGKPSAGHAGLGVVPLPPASMWTQERLDLPFQQQESSTGYVLVAKAPALDTKTLRWQTKGALLTISGVCVPTAQAAAQMQQAVSVQLLRYTLHRMLARGGVAAVTHSLYAQLGEDKYGAFNLTFQLPEDVDAQAIRASGEGGALEVLLPKLRGRALVLSYLRATRSLQEQ